MRDIKNSKGKLICRIDEKDSLVEIVHKGSKTIIRFKPDVAAEVINLEVA